MSNCNNQTKNTIAVNNSLSKIDITKHELKNEYYSYGVQEIKEFDDEIKLTDNLNDLKQKIRNLRKDFPVCKVLKSDFNYFQGNISSTFKIKNFSVVIKLNVLTETEIGSELESYFETVLDDHYDCVLEGFKKVQDLFI